MKSGSSLSTTDDVLLVLLVGGRTADQGLMVLTLQLKWRKNINRTKVMFLQPEILIVLQTGPVKLAEDAGQPLHQPVDDHLPSQPCGLQHRLPGRVDCLHGQSGGGCLVCHGGEGGDQLQAAGQAAAVEDCEAVGQDWMVDI